MFHKERKIEENDWRWLFVPIFEEWRLFFASSFHTIFIFNNFFSFLFWLKRFLLSSKWRIFHVSQENNNINKGSYFKAAQLRMDYWLKCSIQELRKIWLCVIYNKHIMIYISACRHMHIFTYNHSSLFIYQSINLSLSLSLSLSLTLSLSIYIYIYIYVYIQTNAKWHMQ